MILVTTAGKVGTEAALLLRQRELPVRVLVRDPDKAKALADAGAEIAVGRPRRPGEHRRGDDGRHGGHPRQPGRARARS